MNATEPIRKYLATAAKLVGIVGVVGVVSGGGGKPKRKKNKNKNKKHLLSLEFLVYKVFEGLAVYFDCKIPILGSD